MGLLDLILAKLKLSRNSDDDSFEDVKIIEPINDIKEEKLKEESHSEPTDADIDSRIAAILDERIKISNDKLLINIATVIDEVVKDLEHDNRQNTDNKQSVDVSAEINKVKTDIKKSIDIAENVKMLVEEKIKEHTATLDAFIDVVSERVNDDKSLAGCFKRDVCPFDSKIGKCQIWMNRPVKSDAPNYCGPCRLQKMLREKGL